MEISENERRQILAKVSQVESKRAHMEMVVDRASSRIQTLYDKELYLEMVFINSQIVEKHMKNMISFYVVRRRILALLGSKDIYGDVILNIKDDVPLGNIIRVAKDLDFNSDFIERLQDFNNLRRDAVHRLFDGSKDLEAFNLEVKGIFFEEDHTKNRNTLLYEGIQKEYIRIIDDIQEIAKIAGAIT